MATQDTLQVRAAPGWWCLLSPGFVFREGKEHLHFTCDAVPTARAVHAELSYGTEGGIQLWTLLNKKQVTIWCSQILSCLREIFRFTALVSFYEEIPFFSNLEGNVFEFGPLSLAGVLALIVLLFLSLYYLNGITHFFSCLPSKTHCGLAYSLP